MNDSPVRKRALDTSQSFIVQSPAGSGKTELLIQRYLALLSTVELPEQVVAITFTRKAAAQMRARVLAALANAALKKPPSEPHRRETYELARRALARDRHCKWFMIDQPRRLKIDTLDALNSWLAQRLPMSAGGVATARIVEDAREYNALAARRLMQRLGGSSPAAAALQNLLEHSTGTDEVVAKLAGMLSTRDQWLPLLLAGEEGQLRQEVDRALRRSVEDDLANVAGLLPAEAAAQLAPLLRHAAEHAPEYGTVFEEWRELGALPAPEFSLVRSWKALPELLLNKQGGWRKQLSVVGFSRRFVEPQEKLRALIASLANASDLRLALHELRAIPATEPGAAWWDELAALRTTLQHLVAELRVLFAERDAADFVELAFAAQRALGSTTQPSELLLALDRRIQHILVDEFQDTSRSQIRLLELLTAGWEPGDGRSLFLVGDPMQSIYRFRNADMALFLKAKYRGIGDTYCEPLVLTQNFRSSPMLIEWVNSAFSHVFPQTDDIRAGAARFSPSVAARAPSRNETVEVHALRGTDPEAETRHVANIVAEERARSPTGSVAILVQNRAHLTGLRSHLRALGLEAHAVQIEAPNQYQVTQDLIGLTRALTHFADRIAWLAVLRAPWCGIRWRDLHSLCRDDSDSAVWTLMHDPGRIAGLTADGRHRVAAIREILQLAFQSRAAQPLAHWVQRTWVTLGGPACVEDPEDLERAESFFSTLDEIATCGDLDDPAALESLFQDPSSSTDRPRESGIEIMSIHRAKGLEFDSVIVLGLGREPPAQSVKALCWHEQVHDSGEESVLLAPALADSAEFDALTRWVRGMERRKDDSERARLLYVAATRARERLHLVGQLAPGRSSPPPRSLLACLWPRVSTAFESAKAVGQSPKGEGEAFESELRRLAEPQSLAELRVVPPSRTVRRPHFDWAGQATLQVGVVVHRWLQTIARESTESWNGERVRAASSRFREELKLLGVEDGELADASERVIQALDAVLTDPVGLWILANHGEARSELPITLVNDGRLENMRLDRTFIDDKGIRWIIDFKTSSHEGGSTSSFLDSEVKRYRGQLDRYARALASVDSRPIRVGLYFPLLRAFRDWRPLQ